MAADTDVGNTCADRAAGVDPRSATTTPPEAREALDEFVPDALQVDPR